MDTIREIAKTLEELLGDKYKVQTWTNIAYENDTILATFRQFNDPKHYIMTVAKDSEHYVIGEVKE